MKTVTIQIKMCADCPHCKIERPYYADETRVTCDKTKRYIPTTREIPSWCPLPESK